jgi:serpin B
MDIDCITQKLITLVSEFCANPGGGSLRLKGMRARIVLLVTAAIAVVLVAAAIPVLVSDLRSGSAPSGRPSAPARPPAGVRVADRIGAAYQLAAVAHRGAAAPGDPAALSRDEQDFTVALLKSLHASAGAGNLTVSPTSLAVALSMLELGARGETAQQIAAALSTAGLSPAQQSAGWQALVRQWSGGPFTLDSANSVWQQSGMSVPRAYLAALQRYYRTGIWRVDFMHDAAAATQAINDWVDQHTDGRIAKLYDDGALNAQTRLVLANAVYFKAAWAKPFDAHNTRPGSFYAGSAAPISTDFMHAQDAVACAVTADYQAAQLPYQGGRFAALAIMPTRGSLADFVAGLDATKLA